MTCRFAVKAALTAVTTAFLGVVATGAEPIELVPMSGNRYVLRNHMRVAILALVVTHDDQGRYVGGKTLLVNAGDEASYESSGGRASIGLFQPTDPTVPIGRAPASCREVSFSDHATLAQVGEDAKSLQVSRSGAASSEMSAAIAVASLDIDNALDTINTQMSDPFSREMREQLYRNDPRGLQQAEAQAQLDSVYAQQFAMMAANARITEVYLGQLRAEASLLEPLARAAADRRSNLRRTMDAHESEYAAGAAYLARLSQLLGAGARPSTEPMLGSLAEGVVTRACAGVAGSREFLDLQVAAPRGERTLLARLRFSSGETQTTPFRRIGDSTQWRALIYWPPAASRATIELSSLSRQRWTKVASQVTVSRQSMKALVDDGMRQLKQIEDMYKDAKERSEGRDEARTMRIP